MSVKIFLPAKYFYLKENREIYGEIQINENSSVSYFVIAASDSKSSRDDFQNLRRLGQIEKWSPSSKQRDVALSFVYDEETPNVFLHRLSIQPPNTKNVNVFLYDVEKALQLQTPIGASEASKPPPPSNSGDSGPAQKDDMHTLYSLLRAHQRSLRSSNGQNFRSRFFWAALNLPLEIMTRIFVLLMVWRPVVFLLKQSVFYEHYREWMKFRVTGRRNSNIALDQILGIAVMLMLLFYIPHPEEYLIQTSHFIVNSLRLLLDSLKGSPIGLKLNVHLNNFFLDCFKYHVDLWAAFLVIIKPSVRQLFLPMALFGSMGLSFQLALLADLIAIVGLHAHCFYIYSALLYKAEIKGLQVLWKVMLGKRRNLLKGRVEAHNYINRQLYLATIFFTSLLFLFPTILVYYIVFTSLRLCIFLVNILLQFVRRRILEFPLREFFKCLSGNFYKLEALQLRHLQHQLPPKAAPQIPMSVFEINIKSSSLGMEVFSAESGVLQELTTHEETTLKNIFNRILLGKF